MNPIYDVALIIGGFSIPRGTIERL